MRVMITGGAGYLGTELAHRLAACDDVSEIVLYDNLARANYNLFVGGRKFPKGRVRFTKGDLLDTHLLRQSLQGVDVLYHLAAQVTTPYSDHNPHLLEQVNHWGTAEVVYAAEEANVKRFVYTSSTAVYGTSSEPVTIETPPVPTTYYGLSKLRGEEHVARLHQKLPAFIVRVSNVYGYSSSMRFEARINRMMFEAASGQKVTVSGSGPQRRAYVHVDHASSALEALLTADLRPATYVLVGRNLSLPEIVDGVSTVFPDSEFLHINQHLEPWELEVQPDARLGSLLKIGGRSFRDEVREFSERFAILPCG